MLITYNILFAFKLTLYVVTAFLCKKVYLNSFILLNWTDLNEDMLKDHKLRDKIKANTGLDVLWDTGDSCNFFPFPVCI